MASDLEILISARAKIAKGHCKIVYAKDQYGQAVSPKSKDATSYCTVGAIEAAMEDNSLMLERNRIAMLLGLGIVKNVFDWNDGASQQEVLALFDMAIRDLQDKIKAAEEKENHV